MWNNNFHYFELINLIWIIINLNSNQNKIIIHLDYQIINYFNQAIGELYDFQSLITYKSTNELMI